MAFTLLKELGSVQQNTKIKVRVSRMWEAKTPLIKNDILSLECLLIDEEEYSMQATIRKHDAEYLRTLITEGSVYIVEKFNLILAKNNYAVVDRKHMIQFGKWTRFVQVTDGIETFPIYSFYFVDYNYIKSKKQTAPGLIDVIGTIVATASISYTYVAQQQTPIKKLQIQDLNGETISVTLWDEFAINLDNQLNANKEQNGPVIVIFASMTIRNYRDEVYVSTCSASRTYINLQIPKVTEFRNTLRAKQLPIAPIEYIESQDKPLLSPYEQASKNRMSVAKLLEIDTSTVRDTKYTCKATLVSIDTTYGWWYKACYNCKAAVKDFADTFWCAQCGKSDQIPIPWYKLDAIVEDETATTNFIMFGKSVQELIRIPAQQLAIAPKADRFVLPSIFKNVIGQTYIFQISIDGRRSSITGQSFKVTRIFASDLDSKGKKKLCTTNAQNTGEETNEDCLADACRNNLIDEIAQDPITQSPSSQSSPEKAKKRKGKRPFSCIEDNTSDTEEI